MASRKPHAAFIAAPLQSHMNALLLVAKLLHSRSFRITFALTHKTRTQLLASRGPDSVRGLPDFRFEPISDDLSAASLLALVNRLDPPATCIISDIATSFAIDVAKHLRIPCAIFPTLSACGYLACLHYRHHLQPIEFLPLEDASDPANESRLDTAVGPIPGLPEDMRLRDFPQFLLTGEAESFVGPCEKTTEASAIILNTFEIEQPVIDALASICPRVFAIGPLHHLVRQLPDPDGSLAGLSLSLLEKDVSCLEWLDGRPEFSVVYTNLESEAILGSEQLEELVLGMFNSGRDFVLLGSDLVEKVETVLPEEFVAATKGRGLLARWCNQEAVLAHPAVGCFLTDSGWNSMLESVVEGVPLGCWAFAAEQPLNRWFASHEWVIGMDAGSKMERGKVEGLVRELMGGEKGREVRERALEWKERAVKAARPDGSSCRNLDSLISDVLLQPEE